MEDYIIILLVISLTLLPFVVERIVTFCNKYEYYKNKAKKYEDFRKDCFKLCCKLKNISGMKKNRYEISLIKNRRNILDEIEEIFNQNKKKNIVSLQKCSQEYQEKIDNIKNKRCQDKLYHCVEEIVEKEFEELDNFIVRLENKDHPAPAQADKVRIATKKIREYEKKYKLMRYEYNLLFELFPELNNYIEYYDETTNDVTINDIKETFDYVKNIISKTEWEKLSENERNQLALNRYIEKRKKSKWEVGRDYELFIGQEFENNGYIVDFCGIKDGLEDKGRDLIAKKGKEVIVIQCKNWSKDKVIHEKHICQLFGTSFKYGLDNNVKVTPLFVTTTSLSDTALEFCHYLNVKVLQNYQMKEFPRIKCNINKGQKIYHLPFDQQYDRTQIIRSKGEFYAWTVDEAVKAGFKRAKKWIT